MSLILHQPAPPLDQFIYLMWQWEDYFPPHPQERILPIGSMEMVVNLQDTGMQLHYPGHHQAIQIPEITLSGVQSRHFITKSSGSYLSVWFKPNAALPLFHLSGKVLHNLHIPLSDLWGQRAHQLYEQVLTASHATTRFKILESCLLEQLPHARHAHQAIPFALKQIGRQSSIRSIVSQLSLSHTRFIQVFQEAIGLSPKLYGRIQRFQQVLACIATSPEPDWAGLALDYGYFDQAHFINDFQSLAGLSPSQYRAQDPAHPNNLPYWG